MGKDKVSLTVVRRLPRYYHYLNELLEQGVNKISSKELSERMGITASQIRQDLNCFGGFGQQGYGYNVKILRDEIIQILSLDKKQDAVMAGAGNLGRAVANHIDFESKGFRLVGVFDTNPQIIGREVGGLVVQDITELPDFTKKSKPVVGILSVPGNEVVDVAEEMVSLGIRAFWNFTGKDMVMPNVIFENVHLGDSLMTLRYRIENDTDE